MQIRNVPVRLPFKDVLFHSERQLLVIVCTFGMQLLCPKQFSNSIFETFTEILLGKGVTTKNLRYVCKLSLEGHQLGSLRRRRSLAARHLWLLERGLSVVSICCWTTHIRILPDRKWTFGKFLFSFLFSRQGTCKSRETFRSFFRKC